MDHAVENKKIERNPCKGVVLPAESNMVVKTKEQFSLTDEELAIFKGLALIKTKDDIYRYRDRLVLLFILASGLRIGEMLALKWTDIDFDRNLISIHSTAQDSEEGVIIKDGTKNGKKAYLPMNDSIREYLGYLKEYDAYHYITSEYVACTSQGNMHSEQNLGRSLKNMLAKNSKLPQDTTLHTLRHTFGSTLLRKGAKIEVVSKLMRHSNINITIQKYIHVLAQQEVSAMDMINVI